VADDANAKPTTRAGTKNKTRLMEYQFGEFMLQFMYELLEIGVILRNL